MLGPTTEDQKLPSRFGLVKLADKLGGFVRPPGNQSGAAIAPMELRVRSLCNALLCPKLHRPRWRIEAGSHPAAVETNVVSTANWAPWKSDWSLRSWRRWTHQKSAQISQRKGRIYVPNRRWTNQNPRRRSGPENIHLDNAATSSRRE